MAKSSSWSCAGLIYGPDAHYLDHILPICDLLEIPLIVTEESIEQAAKKFYPRVGVTKIDYLSLPEYIVAQFDIIFCCTPRVLFDEMFFFAQKLHNKRVHTIWCPHGNSDKGHASYFMEALNKEEIALVYGQKMIDFLKQKQVFTQLKKHIIMGNLRYFFYQSHLEFFRQIIRQEVARKLPEAEKTILFAPTWNDYENSSSFLDATPSLISTLPPNWNLIIKLHPNLLLENDEKNRGLIWKYEHHPRVLFLEEFPPVYPLLDFVDAYIGDMSSIGYDFLIFNRPMFFLNKNKRDPNEDPGLYLFRCGTQILPEDYSQIFKIMQSDLSKDSSHFSKIRAEVYDYTFGKERRPEELKKDIEKAYQVFPDKDLNFF
jgi:teichoic acid glycerol-phosphate primase